MANKGRTRTNSRAVGPDESPGPIRTCVGCRTRYPAADLVRVAVVDGNFAVDTRGDGRGAWLCRQESCVLAAAKTKAISRALRTKLADAVFADTLLGWLGKPAH